MDWEQVSSLTTDIDAFSMMESFYVGGPGRGEHSLFIFYRGKPEENPLLSLLLFTRERVLKVLFCAGDSERIKYDGEKLESTS